MNEFITTDAELIRDEIITELESSVGGPLYPGDERRMFAEALVAVFVSMYNSLNDAAQNGRSSRFLSTPSEAAP